MTNEEELKSLEGEVTHVIISNVSGDLKDSNCITLDLVIIELDTKFRGVEIREDSND